MIRLYHFLISWPRIKSFVHLSIYPFNQSYINTFIAFPVPSFRQIACFRYSKRLTVLGDFRNDLDWKAADATVEKCAELAFEKEYKHFTLGNSGLCLSGEGISQWYYAGGGMEANKCKQGIGLNGAMYVYTFGKEFN